MTNTTPNKDQWRDWLKLDCTRALMRKVFGQHMPRARGWFLITDTDEMIRTQASFQMTHEIIQYVSGCSEVSTRDICAEAGFEPDQLSE
jgi:hypothetical protein